MLTFQSQLLRKHTMEKISPEKLLKVFLWLVAIHSFCVGISLIFMPTQYLEIFGFYNYRYSFFQTQGGVFHLVMFAAYLLTVKYLDKSPGLVQFTILAKSMATVFLLIYYFFFESSWMLLLSAIGDAVMALVIYLLYQRYLNYK